MGGGPPGHIEEVLDRQRDAVKRRQVLGRGGPHYRIGCGRRGLADIVVGAVAKRVQPRVELIYPVEVAIGHLDRAQLLAAYRRGELDGRQERVNRVVHHGLSFRSGCLVPASSYVPGCCLDDCGAAATAAGASYHGGMRPAGPARDAAAVWDIAVPSRPGRLAGVRMAGFRDRANDLVDLPVVPYPAVTLVIDLGHGPLLVEHASG